MIISFVSGLGVKLYRERVQPLPAVEDSTEYDSSSIAINTSKYFENQEKTEVKSKIKINLNYASRHELEKIPGVGPVTADRIVNYRETYGNFKSLAELEKVKGIGKKTVLKISSFLIIE